jgi:hypothetical protein
MAVLLQLEVYTARADFAAFTALLCTALCRRRHFSNEWISPSALLKTALWISVAKARLLLTATWRQSWRAVQNPSGADRKGISSLTVVGLPETHHLFRRVQIGLTGKLA